MSTARYPGPCAVAGCGGGRYQSNYCSKHYQRLRKHGTPEPAHLAGRKAKALKAVKVCSVDDCDKLRRCGDYCGMHYARLSRTGNHQLASWSPDADSSVEELPDGSTEEWRFVPGYEGRYQASDRGRVRSLPRPKVRSVRVLKASPDVCGYPAVRLRALGGREGSRRVHELILLTFVGPRPGDAELVRHLDGDKTNNALSNLAYGTASENMLDTVRHGTHREAQKTHCARGHEFTKENVYHPPATPRSRACRQCVNDSRNRRRARQRAAGLPVT